MRLWIISDGFWFVCFWLFLNRHILKHPWFSLTYIGPPDRAQFFFFPSLSLLLLDLAWPPKHVLHPVWRLACEIRTAFGPRSTYPCFHWATSGKSIQDYAQMCPGVVAQHSAETNKLSRNLIYGSIYRNNRSYYGSDLVHYIVQSSWCVGGAVRESCWKDAT